jgi:hypothetical protein
MQAASTAAPRGPARPQANGRISSVQSGRPHAAAPRPTAAGANVRGAVPGAPRRWALVGPCRAGKQPEAGRPTDEPERYAYSDPVNQVGPGGAPLRAGARVRALPPLPPRAPPRPAPPRPAPPRPAPPAPRPAPPRPPPPLPPTHNP